MKKHLARILVADLLDCDSEGQLWQRLIHRIDKNTERAFVALMRGPGASSSRVERIDVHKCYAYQRALNITRLRRAVRLYDKMQKNEKRRLPHVILWKGRYFVWDGHHRITAALILGKDRMRAVVLRP